MTPPCHLLHGCPFSWQTRAFSTLFHVWESIHISGTKKYLEANFLPCLAGPWAAVWCGVAVGKAYVPVGAFLLPSAAGSISRARGMTPCLAEAGRAGGPRPVPEQAGLCAARLKGALWLLWARRAPRLPHRTLFVGVTWGWGGGEARARGVPGGLQALRHPQPHLQPYVSIEGLINSLGGLSNTHLAKTLLITCKCVKSRRCEGFVPTSAAWFRVKPPSAAAVSFGCRDSAVNKCFGSLARKPKY